MGLLRQLYGLGFLSPRALWWQWKAGRIHGAGFARWLYWAKQRYSQRTALTDGEQHYSFNDLYEITGRLSARLLQEFPDLPQQTVLMACANQPQHILFLYALQNLGTNLVLVHPHTPLHDNNRIPAGISLIFSDSGNPENDPRRHSISDRVRACTNEGPAYYNPKPFSLVFPTSGTTGQPKLIEKRKGFLYWLKAFADLVSTTGIHRREAVFITVPVTQGYGYTALLFALVLGKKAVLSASSKPADLVSMLLKEKADLIAGVPASLYRIAEGLRGQPHPVKLVISGGAPFSEPTLGAVARHLTRNIFSLYGSTEASTSFIAGYEELSQNVHALGRPLRGIQYRLRTVKEGGQELEVCSPMANHQPGEWLATGDLVARDQAGILYWCGRKDDMLIKNGVNIYPAEVEQALLRLPGVEDALVWGRPDPVAGIKLVACLVSHHTTRPDPDTLKEQLRNQLPGIKIPDEWSWAETLQYTPTGKKKKPV